MAQDVEAMQEKPSNTCCAVLKKKHTKLLEKYSKLEELKNKFRDCTSLVQEKYDMIEKEKESLKKTLEEVKVQANMWKDEKETQAARCVDLEDEVSALQDENRLLKQNDNPASEGVDEQLQKRLVVAENEIKELKELLDQERGRTALEKKNAELEKKKADEALEKVETGKKKVSETQKMANVERKKAEENRLLLEKLKKKTDDLKSMLALEKSKSNAAEKKAEAEKQKAIRERKRADLAETKSEEKRELAETNFKKAMLETDRADELNRKLEEVWNKAEAAENKLKAEKQRALRESKRADMAVTKSEEQRELAETNLKKAMLEKDRADDLNQKLEEAWSRTEKLEEEMRRHKCSYKLVKPQADGSNASRNGKLASDVCVGMLKNDGQLSQWMGKMLLEKEQNSVSEKKRLDMEKKKAKKKNTVAEEHKKMAMEQKHRADQLSRELESYKLSFEELQKELREFISCRLYAKSALGNNGVTSETVTVKILKKQLEMEKLLVKHAEKATKVEALRNKMLHKELCHLKQECLQFQQHLYILDKNFVLGCEGINQLEKIGNETSKREMLCSDGYHRQHVSGTDSRMDPLYGGSNQKMLQSSAINSSSASFSDRPLVGSQERGNSSVMTSANPGEELCNLEAKMARLSDKTRLGYSEHDVAKADKIMGSPIKEGANNRRAGNRKKKRIRDAAEFVENLHSKGQKLHQRVSEKLALLHGILNRKDVAEEGNVKETSCREHSRPSKKRKTSSEGTDAIHCLQKYGEPKNMFVPGIDKSNIRMAASSPESSVMEIDCRSNDGNNNISGCNNCTQDFDKMIANDYMKLLDLDNAADEDSFCRAIAEPLSPLPEFEFIGGENLEVDSSEMLVPKRFQEGLSNGRNNPVSCFHVAESENNHTNLSSHSVPSQLLMNEDSVASSKKLDLLSVNDSDFHQIHDRGRKLGMSELSGTGNDNASALLENGTDTSHGGLPKYFFVSSDNKDSSSILRILQMIDSCMPPCSLAHSAHMFLQSILRTVSKAGDLSTREKACIFFSLTLQGISEVGFRNLINVSSDNLVQSLGSVTAQINSVLSDPELRMLFMESCDLFELLTVIEDFILQRKVLFCGDVSAEPEFHLFSKFSLILDSNTLLLSEVSTPAPLLVAGGSLLASLCLAVDHIGFVCEVSCNIIRMQKFEPAVMLAVLHAFAHICGPKFFNLQQYCLALTVVKSFVMFLEKQTLSIDSTSFSPSEDENPSKIWPCTNCPFGEGAVPMEDIAMVLLENLQKQCCSELCLHDSLALVNLLVPRVRSNEEVTEEVSGLREAEPLVSASDENSCNFIDALSLVEVLASCMSWDWTSCHLIGQICEYLESHLVDGSSAAIIILLGQLGRLGVGSSGYDDAAVKKLREWLSAFICENTFMKLNLPIQFAIMTSLFCITPIKFEEIVDGKVEIPAVMSQSIPASFIREWFLALSHEQQSFLRLHQATGESSC